MICEAHYSAHGKAWSTECNEGYKRIILYRFQRRQVSQPSDSGQQSWISARSIALPPAWAFSQYTKAVSPESCDSAAPLFSGIFAVTRDNR